MRGTCRGSVFTVVLEGLLLSIVTGRAARFSELSLDKGYIVDVFVWFLVSFDESVSRFVGVCEIV